MQVTGPAVRTSDPLYPDNPRRATTRRRVTAAPAPQPAESYAVSAVRAVAPGRRSPGAGTDVRGVDVERVDLAVPVDADVGHHLLRVAALAEASNREQVQRVLAVLPVGAIDPGRSFGSWWPLGAERASGTSRSRLRLPVRYFPKLRREHGDSDTFADDPGAEHERGGYGRPFHVDHEHPPERGDCLHDATP